MCDLYISTFSNLSKGCYTAKIANSFNKFKGFLTHTSNA